MRGQSPAWLLYIATGISASVLVYCLWTGKVGRTTTRAKNPLFYWGSVLSLAVIVCRLIRTSLSQ
jgi:hypothetical protein